MEFGLTSMQSALLTFVSSKIACDGISPSYTEIMEALGCRSKSHVNSLVRALEERGAIRRLPGQSRSIIPVVHEEVRTDDDGETIRVYLSEDHRSGLVRYARQRGQSPQTAAAYLLSKAIASLS